MTIVQPISAEQPPRFAVDCPARDLFDQLADKWSMMILSILKTGPARFNQLKRYLEGVSQKSLSMTLKRLERNGIITREVQSTNPPSVTYQLTALGHSLLQPLCAMYEWTCQNMGSVEKARSTYDLQQSQR